MVFWLILEVMSIHDYVLFFHFDVYFTIAQLFIQAAQAAEIYMQRVYVYNVYM